MRGVVPALIAIAGCGSSDHNAGPADAAGPPPIDAPPIDAPPPPDACVPTPLLVPGTDITTQGWTPFVIQPATLDNAAGATVIGLTTSTPTNGQSGGQLLLTRPNTIVAGTPIKIEVQMQVVRVDVHDQFDAGAAIMAAVTGQVGTMTERGDMIYLDPGQIGFADNSKPTFTFNNIDGAFHSYVVAIDAASTLTLTVDGTLALTRAHFTTNGTFAIGDQTNDAGVDSMLLVRSVSKLCQ
jgi:hypothetical protein